MLRSLPRPLQSILNLHLSINVGLQIRLGLRRPIRGYLQKYLWQLCVWTSSVILFWVWLPQKSEYVSAKIYEETVWNKLLVALIRMQMSCTGIGGVLHAKPALSGNQDVLIFSENHTQFRLTYTGMWVSRAFVGPRGLSGEQLPYILKWRSYQCLCIWF